jgi:iron complex transport system ATP-binding protein
MEAQAGALVALVGPNGSGKTSLLHALAGVGRPSGEVRIGGEDPRRLHPARRKHLLTYLPAARDAAWPVMARDLVALGLSGANADEAVNAALDALGLMPFADRRVDRLSTGERSRILIARALAPRPKLLLLDEPAANLDPAWQLRLMALLRERARNGAALIVAMHDLDLASRFADRLVVMNEKRIEADGEPAALLAGAVIPSVFGIVRDGAIWRPVA